MLLPTPPQPPKKNSNNGQGNLKWLPCLLLWGLRTRFRCASLYGDGASPCRAPSMAANSLNTMAVAPQTLCSPI